MQRITPIEDVFGVKRQNWRSKDGKRSGSAIVATDAGGKPLSQTIGYGNSWQGVRMVFRAPGDSDPSSDPASIAYTLYLTITRESASFMRGAKDSKRLQDQRNAEFAGWVRLIRGLRALEAEEFPGVPPSRKFPIRETTESWKTSPDPTDSSQSIGVAIKTYLGSKVPSYNDRSKLINATPAARQGPWKTDASGMPICDDQGNFEFERTVFDEKARLALATTKENPQEHIGYGTFRISDIKESMMGVVAPLYAQNLVVRATRSIKRKADVAAAPKGMSREEIVALMHEQNEGFAAGGETDFGGGGIDEPGISSSSGAIESKDDEMATDDYFDDADAALEPSAPPAGTGPPAPTAPGIIMNPYAEATEEDEDDMMAALAEDMPEDGEDGDASSDDLAEIQNKLAPGSKRKRSPDSGAGTGGGMMMAAEGKRKQRRRG